MRIRLIAGAWFFILFSAPVFAIPPMGCQRVADAKMIFIESFVMRAGGDIPYRVGRFRVANNLEKSLVLRGGRLANGVLIPYSPVHLEVQIANGGWKYADLVGGDWSLPEVNLTVPPRASREFVTLLDRNQEFAKLDGPFRLVIYSSPQGCVVSEPFALRQEAR